MTHKFLVGLAVAAGGIALIAVIAVAIHNTRIANSSAPPSPIICVWLPRNWTKRKRYAPHAGRHSSSHQLWNACSICGRQHRVRNAPS